MKHKLVDIAKYDKKKKCLILRGTEEKIQLELSKNHSNLLEKEIEEAKSRAEKAKRAMRQEAGLKEVETTPGLPERNSTGPVIKSPPSESICPAVLPKSPAVSDSENEFKVKGTIVTALYDYEPNEEDELKITEDEKLLLVDDSDEDWWLVQRLEGGKKKGLVPSSYVAKPDPFAGKFRDPIQAAEDEADVPRSPEIAKKFSRPSSPVVPGFLDELKKKTKARSPISEPEEPVTVEEAINQTEPVFPVHVSDHEDSNVVDEVKEVDNSEKFIAGNIPERPQTEPAKLEEQELAKVPVSIPAPPPLPNFSSEEVVKREAPVVSEKPKEPEIIRQPAKEVKKPEFPIPKLKPVLEDESGFNAISTMLLRKQEDIRNMNQNPESLEVVNDISKNAPKKAEKEEAKPNPWKDLNMKKMSTKAESAPRVVAPIAPKVTASVNVSVAPKTEPKTMSKASFKSDVSSSVPSMKSLPSRPTQVSSDKPIPADTRLWTSRNGQFQVEAKYVGYQGGKVNLHKLNGNKIAVPIDQLCERDKEFVYRQEGIPWDQGPKKEFRVGTFDWLDFFKNAGVESKNARAYAQICLDRKIGESFMLSATSFTRDYLLAMGMSESDVIEVLRYCNGIRSKRVSEEETRKTLEKIQQVKQQAEIQKRQLLQQQPLKPQTTTVRRPSESFDFIELPVLQKLTLGSAAPSTEPRKTVNDIPVIQPTRSNEPKTFTSTTVVNQPSAVQIPPNPLASYTIPNVSIQHVQSGYLQPTIPAHQPNQPYDHQAYLHQQQQQHNSRLPNLIQPKSYQPIQQPYQTQQQFHNLQGPTILGTTQYRTEVYGGGGQPAMQVPMQYNMHPHMQSHPQQQQYYHQSQPQAQLPSLQSLQGGTMRPNQGTAGNVTGDKYSIFKYVDPNAPQLLGQVPPAQPPPNQSSSYPYGQGWQQ